MKKSHWTLDKSDEGNIIPMTEQTEELLSMIAKQLHEGEFDIHKPFQVSNASTQDIIISQYNETND
jgi:hypothetical protein|tara:strand:- start:967 stop:1164 length:198 start_codon:yes stop_codon:yes gene_type:complete